MDEVSEGLSALGDQAQVVGEELRRIAPGIYAPVLATCGLAEALAAEARLSGVAVRILASCVGSSTAEVELAVCLCCLEAMQNAAEHVGREARVPVRLSHDDDDELTFSLADDGGSTPPTIAWGTALRTARAGQHRHMV